ncbi:uncharacterized protein LOC141714225 [Apium graveolens]|uniref:uncharacterized protein LOC141714225 n=1 Tax=Apium graveolens TaxID=4045 RepID=UPI003D796B0B
MKSIYGPQRSQLLMSATLPNVGQAVSILQQEEAQRNQLHSVTPDLELSAKYSRSTQPRSSYNQRSVQCSACNVKGHTRERCWTVIGYPPWHPKHRGNLNAPRGRILNNTPLSKWPSKSLSSTKALEPEDDLEFHFSGMISCHNSTTLNHEWILDSGASDHMTPHMTFLQNAAPTSNSPRINLPNGDTTVISHTCIVSLPNGLNLIGVLHVPSFKHNFLSVQRLIKDNNCQVQFFSNHCYTVDVSSHKVVGVGIARDGLYYYNPHKPSVLPVHSFTHHIQKSNRKSQHVSLISTTSANLNLWHHRLGHAPIDKVKQISNLPNLPKHYSTVCLTCPLARFTKLPFPSSESHSKVAFDLVHLDIWGPYKENTKGTCRYFLTLVDDHTRYTWVYILSNKSDSLKTLKAFYNYVKTHFAASIKSIRSDNGMEFVNALSRALRFQANLPLHLWGDCVLTAVHLINRLPTHLLSNKSPYEAFYAESPDYDNIRVFGCLAISYNPTVSIDKFAARGIPCVFLGYPATKKGYRLLNLSTMVEFVSRDVKFHEEIFPFSPNTGLHYMQPLPINMPDPVQTQSVHMFDEEYISDEFSRHPSLATNNDLQISQSSVHNDIQDDIAVVRRSTRAHRPPQYQQDYITNYSAQPVANIADLSINASFNCFLATVTTTKDPVHFKEAAQQHQWVSSMNDELEALERNGTWTMVALNDINLVLSSWVADKNMEHSKMAANATTTSNSTSPGLLFTPQQLEQLTQLVPQLQLSSTKALEPEVDLEFHFSGMISCHNSTTLNHEWILDSGALDHMTPHMTFLQNAAPTSNSPRINLPNGDTTIISHTCIISLPNGLNPTGVLRVPSFKHNLLSAQRLIKDNNCQVQFFSNHCYIVDVSSHKVVGVGIARDGLYYYNPHKPSVLPVRIK